MDMVVLWGPLPPYTHLLYRLNLSLAAFHLGHPFLIHQNDMVADSCILACRLQKDETAAVCRLASRLCVTSSLVVIESTLMRRPNPIQT